MAKLVTGGTGYVGSETVRELVNRGEEVVIFDVAVNTYRIEDVEKKIKIVRGDLGNFSEVLNVFKSFKIDAIYHMGSMLNRNSEINPWASFQTNVVGTYHVLEAARIFDVPKMMLTSSRGTFGLGSPEIIDDWTLQRPVSFYGCGKVYCEGVGRWYSKKFGLDFRSVRYPAMIAPNVRTPGHSIPPMIEDAILGRQNVCQYAAPETRNPLIYVKDAAKAAIDLLDAPKENIHTINYNVTGVQEYISVKETEAYLKNRYPGFEVVYQSAGKIAPSAQADVKIFSDSYAKKEWNWRPNFSTLETIVEQFEKDFREYPGRYGIIS
jgi:threonine 3-dehydrogenase